MAEMPVVLYSNVYSGDRIGGGSGSFSSQLWVGNHMGNDLNFYIDGQWVAPAVPTSRDVINPATEEVAGRISLGSAADVDRAAQAARRAFPRYSAASREERVALLQRIIKVYEARIGELAGAMTAEMG